MTRELSGFGTDFGGVITPSGNRNDTSFFADNYLATPSLPDSLNTLAALRLKYDDLYVVSKCGPRIQARTLEWMEHHDFHEITGITPDHVVFCLERPQKAEICRALGIIAFVDDRADVLGHLDPDMTRYLFSPRSQGAFTEPQGLVPVTSWRDIAALELGL